MEILVFPNKKLRELSVDCDLSSDVEKKNLSGLIAEMQKTLYDANGIGLAAPQVGVSKRLFIIDVDQKVEKDDNDEVISRTTGKLHVLINPEIVEKEGEVVYEEGCLSVPGVYEEVKRYKKIVIEFYDINFEKKKLVAEGIMSVAIQHENDHLDGKLFIDRLPIVKRTIVKKRILKGKVF